MNIKTKILLSILIIFILPLIMSIVFFYIITPVNIWQMLIFLVIDIILYFLFAFVLWILLEAYWEKKNV